MSTCVQIPLIRQLKPVFEEVFFVCSLMNKQMLNCTSLTQSSCPDEGPSKYAAWKNFDGVLESEIAGTTNLNGLDALGPGGKPPGFEMHTKLLR
jgi:hypothetical protein